MILKLYEREYIALLRNTIARENPIILCALFNKHYDQLKRNVIKHNTRIEGSLYDMVIYFFLKV